MDIWHKIIEFQTIDKHSLDDRLGQLKEAMEEYQSSNTIRSASHILILMLDSMAKLNFKPEDIFNETGERADQWFKKADETFDFARDALNRFEKGEPMDKKEVFSKLGSNLLLKNKTVVIDMENTLIPMKAVSWEAKRLEPLKIGKNTREIEELYAQSPRMLP